MSNAKYHHLIPRTYTSAWTHGNGDSLYVVDKSLPETENVKEEEKNSNRFFGVTGFHRIKPGMPICSSIDCKTLFAPLSQYTVSIDGQVLQSVEEMNKNWYQFDRWEIFRSDGSLVSKKSLKSEIEKIVINDIEEEWSKQYENEWPTHFQEIETIIGSGASNIVPEFSKEYLMKFMLSMDWRGFCSNKQFTEAYEGITSSIQDIMSTPVDEKDRYLPMLDTFEKEIEHCLLLNQYRKFLSGTGLIEMMSDKSVKYTTFSFMVATGAHHFITSDNPAFEYKRPDGYKEVIMAVSPTILMIQCRDSLQKVEYYKYLCDDAQVMNYNQVIANYAEQYVIMDDIEYRFLKNGAYN